MRDSRQPTDDGRVTFARQASLMIVALVLTCAAVDLAHSYLANHFESKNVPWNAALYQTGIFWLTYTPMVPLAFLLANRFRIDRPDRHNIAIHIVAALAFAYLHTISFAALGSIAWHTSGSLVRQMFHTMRINFPIDLTSYWAIVGVTYAFYYRSESQERGLESARLETATAQLEHSLTQARLRALQAQLNPHFLFNTLNAISVLSRKGENHAVVDVVAGLSRLLRICLDDKRPQHIRLSDELEFLDVYLDIQKLSLGDRLTVRRNIAEDVLDAEVPSMILQPLVENAIVHGIAGHSGQGTISVEARRNNGTLCMSVTDSGGGFRTEAAKGSGIGLGNTEARLQQIYGSAQQIEHCNLSDGGASVTIVIPFLRSTRYQHA